MKLKSTTILLATMWLVANNPDKSFCTDAKGKFQGADALVVGLKFNF